MDRVDSATVHWFTSSYSDAGECVEVAVTDGVVLVRHSWNRHVGHIVFPRVQWQVFVEALGPAGAWRGGTE